MDFSILLIGLFPVNMEETYLCILINKFISIHTRNFIHSCNIVARYQSYSYCC